MKIKPRKPKKVSTEFVFDAESTNHDDGKKCIKPNDIDPSKPGRWIINPAWLALEGKPHGVLMTDDPNCYTVHTVRPDNV